MKKSEIKVSQATIAALRNLAKRHKVLCGGLADHFIAPYIERVGISLKTPRTAYSLAEAAFSKIHDERALIGVFLDQTDASPREARTAAASFSNYIDSLRDG